MLESLNARLKTGRIGVTVEQRGDYLYLVATLPPKPHSGKIRSHQQRIALGVRANPAGFKRAELEAKKLGVQLAEGSFTWGHPQPQPQPQSSENLGLKPRPLGRLYMG